MCSTIILSQILKMRERDLTQKAKINDKYFLKGKNAKPLTELSIKTKRTFNLILETLEL